MHKINEHFEKVVCINLAERPDKKKTIQERFDKLGIEVEWFTAVKYDFLPNIVPPINASKQGHFNPRQPYEMGAALSHYHVIKQALLEGVERLFVFEDDALFHKGFNQKFEKYYKALPEKWDMIMLYSFMYEWLPQNERINAYWFRAFKSWSLMAYGMNQSFMKAYIKQQDKFFSISDSVTYHMQSDPAWKIYSTAPALCIPSPAESNIRQQKNYEQNITVTNWGYSAENYE